MGKKKDSASVGVQKDANQGENFYILEESIGYNVRFFTKVLRHRLIRNFRDKNYEVTIDEWIAIAFLYRFEDRNQLILGDFLMQDKTAVTRLLDNLEKKKFVRRTIDRRDKRNRIIKLTAAGRREFNKLRPVVEKTIKEAKNGVSEADYQLTVNTLKKMATNLVDLA